MEMSGWEARGDGAGVESHGNYFNNFSNNKKYSNQSIRNFLNKISAIWSCDNIYEYPPLINFHCLISTTAFSFNFNLTTASCSHWFTDSFATAYGRRYKSPRSLKGLQFPFVCVVATLTSSTASQLQRRWHRWLFRRGKMNFIPHSGGWSSLIADMC